MLIHSSGSVYYHYQLIFLSKLTHRGITRFLCTAPEHRFAWLTDWRHSRWPARVHLSAVKRDASFASRKTTRSRRRWRCDTSNRTDGHASSSSVVGSTGKEAGERHLDGTSSILHAWQRHRSASNPDKKPGNGRVIAAFTASKTARHRSDCGKTPAYPQEQV